MLRRIYLFRRKDCSFIWIIYQDLRSVRYTNVAFFCLEKFLKGVVAPVAKRNSSSNFLFNAIVAIYLRTQVSTNRCNIMRLEILHKFSILLKLVRLIIPEICTQNALGNVHK